jgi:hypothetical protein
MDLAKILQQLHEEMSRLDAAIESLERLQTLGTRRGTSSGLLLEDEKRNKGRQKGPGPLDPPESGE